MGILNFKTSIISHIHHSFACGHKPNIVWTLIYSTRHVLGRIYFYQQFEFLVIYYLYRISVMQHRKCSNNCMLEITLYFHLYRLVWNWKKLFFQVCVINILNYSGTYTLHVSLGTRWWRFLKYHRRWVTKFCGSTTHVQFIFYFTMPRFCFQEILRCHYGQTLLKI